MAQVNLRAVITATDRTGKALSGFAKNTESMSDRMKRAATRAAQAFTVATTAAVTFGLKAAADLESAEIGFHTLLGSAEAASSTMSRIKREAARTPFQIMGLTQATQLLSAVTQDGDRALEFILDIGEGLAAMGRGQAELDRISVNLQQIAANGRAFGIDIRQFAFAGIPIYKMLQEEVGLTGEALSDFIEDGGVTFDLLEGMFKSAIP
jgi:tape measure domain-containing protein